MVIGIDMGASAVKLCVLEGDEVALTHYENGRVHDVPTLLARLGVDAKKAAAIAVTGLSFADSQLGDAGLPIKHIPEPDAIGAGAVWLSGRDNVIVASIGTGSAFIHAREGKYTHLCGTGVGGGTLKGLSSHVLGIENMKEFDRMALAGDTGRVDLLIGDFVTNYGKLDPYLTASNLARENPDASRDDWAAGISNMVLQVIGTMSLLACTGQKAAGVVVTGALAGSELSRRNFATFTSAYGVDYFIPEHSDCATAIGAARLAT